MSPAADDDLPIPERVQILFGGSLRIGYMGTVRADGQLSVVPVGVMIHEGKLRISSPSATRKIRNLQRNPQISLCVPDPADPRRFLTVRGTAEVADDTDRSFVDWMARTHMGREEYPFESRDVARTVITIRPRRFVMPRVHGADR